MNFSNLKPALASDIREWLNEELKNERIDFKFTYAFLENLRRSPYYFYERRPKTKGHPLFRLTLIFVPIYWFILVIGLPFTMIITGRWGYGRKFIDGFHNNWMNKLGL